MCLLKCLTDRIQRPLQKPMKNYNKWLFSIAFTFLLLEIALRLKHNNQTYTESIGQGYQSYFGRESNSWFLQWPINDTFTVDHGDFKYRYVTDDLGFREKPTSTLIDSSLNKIITLGDSYTEGVGAAYDSSWPRFFERSLRQTDPKAIVFNAGINGSDPFYASITFREKLAKFRPALVISAVNATDIEDFFFRGGMERFKEGGKLANKKGPWFEPLYKYSYVVRMILVDFMQKRPQLFVTNKEFENTEDEFIKQTTVNYVAFKRAFIDTGKLLVVIHPEPDECAYINHADNKHTHAVMLRLLESLHQNGIAAVDLYPSIASVINEQNVNQFTYPHDRHYNARGYKLFSDKLLAEVAKNYPFLYQQMSLQ